MRRFSARFSRLVASLVAGGALSILLAPALSTNAMAAGMPQMDFKNPLVMAQVIWVLIIFFCLFLAVKYFSIPQIEQVIHNRRSKIDGDMDSARQAKAQADKAVEALNKTRSEAAAEAQAKIDSIIQETRVSSAKQMQELQARLDNETREAETRIVEARNGALKQVDQMAKDVAQSLLKQLLKEDVQGDLINKTVQQVLTAKS
ncbi:FoF1-type ATP synthase [Commensalibacter communis]|uniref:ATP synthase subunit b n=1 Tax=Commensalibacter communis TaxID=2972786 RepID=A0A9W4TNZ5_9PROT|nr:hypothetical protein [Commensalibacter communis]CAI3935617.1 FoF1-type ATP synthase [Commensalibacter communis]CAI3937565.1 FoF1-type ATP synthase [Commensalibacter communis]CAI3942472.1 FoF1-type ATP synthase [Commensalibacter communis]CAI3942594.1 FoF1-type ATP synthase [Commensalibacter communis]CAI3942756.1 FoF1-type ATP synthase [Commensalibacter communis]